MNELKPCPFCGNTTALVVLSENEIEMHDKVKENAYFAVICSVNEIGTEISNFKTGCGGSSGYKETETEAIELWNTRAERKGNEI